MTKTRKQHQKFHEQERHEEPAQTLEEFDDEQLEDVSGGAKQRSRGIKGEDILNP